MLPLEAGEPKTGFTSLFSFLLSVVTDSVLLAPKENPEPMTGCEVPEGFEPNTKLVDFDGSTAVAVLVDPNENVDLLVSMVAVLDVTEDPKEKAPVLASGSLLPPLLVLPNENPKWGIHTNSKNF